MDRRVPGAHSAISRFLNRNPGGIATFEFLQDSPWDWLSDTTGGIKPNSPAFECKNARTLKIFIQAKIEARNSLI